MRDDPTRLKDLLGPMGQRLGLRDPAQTGLVWSQWESIVGPGIAAHCRPSSLREGVLRLLAEGPTWATEVGYLAEEIKRKVNDAAGSQLVTEVRVWVAPPGSRPARGGSSEGAPKGGQEDRSERPPRVPPEDPQEALARAREAWFRRRSKGRS
jgi:hypothetical protein